jgi:DDE superfamily endonuclease
MPGIIEFPQVVQDAVKQFGDQFANEPQRRHFAEYLTGLMIAERKSVLGINREFAQTTDQSCLNKFLTEVDWDAEALNQRRLDWLQRDSSTRYTDRGVIPIDNVLIDHDGKFIKDAGWFWDHADQRNKIAHDYRYRWTGTETFHRDGKQELGMGDCQLRDGQGQTRHMYLVMLAYSLLMDQLGQNRAKAWALRKLTTIGEACRAMLRETLRSTIAWAIEQVNDYSHDLDHITVRLRLT